jgi:hypothetical protein
MHRHGVDGVFVVLYVLMEFTRGILVFGINWFNNAALALWICASRVYNLCHSMHECIERYKIEYGHNTNIYITSRPGELRPATKKQIIQLSFLEFSLI